MEMYRSWQLLRHHHVMLQMQMVQTEVQQNLCQMSLLLEVHTFSAAAELSYVLNYSLKQVTI